MLEADEKHGWFRLKDSNVFYSLKDIINVDVTIDTIELSEKEKEDRKQQNTSFLAWLFSDDGYKTYSELPHCPSDRKVTDMHFNIELDPHELGVSKLEIDLMPGLSTDFESGQKAFDCAHELYAFIQPYIKFGTPVASTASVTSELSGQADPYEELKKLKELLDLGVITKDDYNKKKKQLLGI